MYCKKCGTPIKEGEKFCRKCGASVITNLVTGSIPVVNTADSYHISANNPINNAPIEDMPETYMGLAVTCFFLCLPISLFVATPALVNAKRVSKFWFFNRVREAEWASKRAKQCVLVALYTAIGINPIPAIIYFFCFSWDTVGFVVYFTFWTIISAYLLSKLKKENKAAC